MPNQFPNDPVLGLLPEEAPDVFLRLTPEEQRVRGRYFLMVWVLYRDIAYSWFNALADEPGDYARMRETVDGTPDQNLLAAIRAAYREEDEARGVAADTPVQ